MFPAIFYPKPKSNRLIKYYRCETFQELSWKEWTPKEDEYDVYKTHIPLTIGDNRPDVRTKKKEKKTNSIFGRAREMQKVGKSVALLMELSSISIDLE